MTVSVRIGQRSLSQTEYAALPLEAQAEYSRQVRAANPELYTPDVVRRWFAAMQGRLQAEHQADHYDYIRDGEKRIGRKP